jgi:ribonuclease HI
MMFDPRAVQIHTDGSAYRNPGHVSGCAVIACYPDHLHREDEIIVDFGCPKSTNQRMELTACIEGLKWVRRHVPWDGVTCVLVVTDSQHVKEFVGLGRVAQPWPSRSSLTAAAVAGAPSLRSEGGDFDFSLTPIRNTLSNSTIRILLRMST